jgi:hypothetical protein
MNNSDSTLRKRGHYSKVPWNILNLQAGFERFFDENGHYPSVTEIDKFEYLPTPRNIQRSFGGLMKLRSELNLRQQAPNHNSGNIRSLMAARTSKDANSFEEYYYKYLTGLIPELYVHEHKIIRYKDKKTDCDYFIYFPNSSDGIVIDIFYAQDIGSAMKQVNLKAPKYEPMPFDCYFVCMNKDIGQGAIDWKILNKKNGLKENLHVYNIDEFNSKVLPKVASKYERRI